MWVSFSGICFPTLEGTQPQVSKSMEEREPLWDPGSGALASANLLPSFFPQSQPMSIPRPVGPAPIPQPIGE